MGERIGVDRQYGNMAGITVCRVYSREKIKESKWRERGRIEIMEGECGLGMREEKMEA